MLYFNLSVAGVPLFKADRGAPPVMGLLPIYRSFNNPFVLTLTKRSANLHEQIRIHDYPSGSAPKRDQDPGRGRPRFVAYMFSTSASAKATVAQ